MAGWTRYRLYRALHRAILGRSHFTHDLKGRKIREWTTLDWIVNYTFNFPAPAAQNEVAGYAKDGGKNAKMKGGKDKNVMPVSTAEYNPWAGAHG